VRVLEIDESRRRISLSVKRAQPSQALPLRDLIPAEAVEEATPAPAELPDLDVSDEVFPETGASQEAETVPSELADESGGETEAEAEPEPETEPKPEPEAGEG